MALILGALSACSTPAPPRAPAAATASAPEVAAEEPAFARPASRWVPVEWSALPGWQSDRTSELWGAFLRSCERPAPGWTKVCAQAHDEALSAPSDSAARAWLQARMQVYRVETRDGKTEGLATGYFEPLIEASRLPRRGFLTPLYAPPADLNKRRPYWTRQQIETVAAAQAALKGHEIAYVGDPLDALVLQVQGSGRLQMRQPDGTSKLIRLAFAGHNGHPYQSVGRWLIDQGELNPSQASWPAIRRWAEQHPERVPELMGRNPRYVFFREEPLPDPTVGPKGAQGVALTPGRSIAVDPQSIPYGSIVWLDTTEPLSNTPLRRLVMAQDTGSAIVGAVRADYFWGWGAAAEAQAGRMKQALRMWVLWPKTGLSRLEK